MIETLLGLVPTYGLWLILVSVLLSCLALPIPSSMMVMAAGGFSAAGDFAYWQLVLFAFAGFLIGDQAAFLFARKAGTPMIDRIKARPKTGKIIANAEDLIAHHGMFAVILTRTILSPIGPYVAYISGALRLGWMKFSATAAVGALIWCLGYSWLGYTFADQIAEIASLIGSSIGIILAGSVAAALIAWLVRNFRHEVDHEWSDGDA